MSIKNILITGSTGILGKCITQSLDNKDNHLIVHGRDEIKLKELENNINNAKVTVISNDLLDETSWQNVAKELKSLYGLICCAGGYGEIGALGSYSIEKWKESFEVNFYGSLIPIHFLIPSLKKNGEGRIILFSGGGQKELPNFTPYISAKGAIWRLVETLGAELINDKITVNGIAPGAINSKFLTDVLDAGPEQTGRDFYENALKQKETGGSSPKKTAELVEFLLSPKAQDVTGKIISSLWDEMKTRDDLGQLPDSDIFTYKRVIDFNGNTKF